MLKVQVLVAMTAIALLAGCSDESKIAGRYHSSQGSDVEFLKDGTVIFSRGSQQSAWKWSIAEGKRIKFELTPNPFGEPVELCGFMLVSDQGLRLDSCRLAMSLRRI